MTFRRYSFLVTDCTSGTERRFSLPLLPALAGFVAILLLPILVGLGARWAVRTDLQDLAATAIALRMENDSYRDATGQLASQIAALQGAVDDIGARAAVDPAASRAMDRLPAVVKSRAMGGGTGSVAPLLGSAIGSPIRRSESCAICSSASRIGSRSSVPASSGARRWRSPHHRSGLSPAGCRRHTATGATRSPAEAIFIPGWTSRRPRANRCWHPRTRPSRPPVSAETTATWSSSITGSAS